MGAVKFVEMPDHQVMDPLAASVRAGLSSLQPSLPSRFFYDAEGSDLFERIMDLPEYYLTRCEHSILSQHASEILDVAGAGPTIVEFGSGNSLKTRLLIEAALAARSHLHYVPIDISAECLRSSTAELQRLYPELAITAFAAEYHDAIPLLPDRDASRLFLLMGSNIGNFEANEARDFLRHIRRHMSPHDRLLIGMDLVKEPAIIEAAYNDSAGVTAAFNKNLLTRINRELGGNFDVRAFQHEAPFVTEKCRVEMRLRASETQTVRICELDEVFIFPRGSYIHTENSHKYDAASFEKLALAAGLRSVRTWTDEADWFAVSLLEPD